jgi:hypothetical protein
MICETVEEPAPIIGTRPACRALARARVLDAAYERFPERFVRKPPA